MEQKTFDSIYTTLNQTVDVMHGRIKKEITPFGLNYNEYENLKYMYRNGDQPIQKIGEEIRVTSGSMTYLIDKLEKNSHIVRVPCTKDGRVMYASLTREGKELMDKVMPICSSPINQAIEEFEEEDINRTIQILDQIKNRLAVE